MKKISGGFFWWVFVPSFLYVILGNFLTPNDKAGVKHSRIIYSEFLDKIQDNRIKSIEIKGEEIYGVLKNGDTFNTYVPHVIDYNNMVENIRSERVEIKISRPPQIRYAIGNILLNGFGLLLLIWLFTFEKKAMGYGDRNPFGFVKSRARLAQTKNKVTFDDVAGVDEARDELKELVDFLKDPEKYTTIGARIPRGCLLMGAPGTGKTLLAKAVAGEAGVPFYSISGSDFIEVFVGVGASRVRDMFSEAKKNAPCLIFIDEIDAVGERRSGYLGGGADERNQTLNQLLVEMDGFEANEGIIVIGATNREDVLDKALLRPGRFDRQITIEMPDVEGREKILKIHAKKMKMAPNVDIKSIAKSTTGFSGAELANIINEAGLLAARINKKVITNSEIEEAKERVVMGIRNQSRIKKEEETKLIAYHEAGHAIVAINCENSNPIYKATIISRGRVGGYVSRLPDDDGRLTSATKIKLMDDITIAMGGRAAEEIIFGAGKITAGAESDFEMATNVAKNMVARFGMSDNIGPIHVIEKLENSNWRGFEASSDETLEFIDREIKNILLGCKKTANEIIVKNRENLVIVAEALLKYETLGGQEIKDLVEGKKIREEPTEGGAKLDSTSLFVKIMEENKNEQDTKS
ncbi:MAG: ATP-dependent zinc metalloprotease FtsH [Rickettsiales bacterium]|jgi:cell division protease FtsH|nr:ATP-dependent zinc metalloprotease FtsH [Rickettsiales bacterium]